MISHVTIAVRDFDRALGFYGAVFDAIGLEQSFRSDTGQAVAFRKPGTTRPLFFLALPFDGARAEPGNGPMTAFLCDSRDQVDLAHATGLKMGAKDERQFFEIIFCTREYICQIRILE